MMMGKNDPEVKRYLRFRLWEIPAESERYEFTRETKMNAGSKTPISTEDLIAQVFPGGSPGTIKHVFSTSLSDCSLGTPIQRVQKHSRCQ